MCVLIGTILYDGFYCRKNSRPLQDIKKSRKREKLYFKNSIKRYLAIIKTSMAEVTFESVPKRKPKLSNQYTSIIYV